MNGVSWINRQLKKLRRRKARPAPSPGAAWPISYAMMTADARGRRHALEELERRILLSTITVTTLDDGAPTSDGEVTLREAIQAANSDTAVGDAPAGSGADIIEFAQGLLGNIDLTNGQFGITSDITINGGGNITINGGDVSRLFSVNGSGALTLNELTLTGGVGLTGGAIDVRDTATVTINDSVIEGNRANQRGGAIFVQPTQINGASVSIFNSIITNNHADNDGGAIGNNTGQVGIYNSTISNNMALGTGDGGAIWHTYGFLDVINSTLDNNTAASNGGGIYSTGDASITIDGSTISNNAASGSFGGGGIYNTTGSGGFIGNSTISGNTSTNAPGGGLFLSNGIGFTMQLVSNTITNNTATQGGGVRVFNSAYAFSNNLIAGNTATTDPDFSGSATSLNHNLIGDGTGTTSFTGGSDLVGTGIAPIDPMLGPLADNGGPTMTHAIDPSSPAVDAGSNNVGFFSTDQRGGGFNRIVDLPPTNANDGTDIGSFELTPPQPDLLIELDESKNLIITDIANGGRNDDLTIASDDATDEFVITDASGLMFTEISGATGSGTSQVRIPISAVTGTAITINGMGGDDALAVDLDSGNFDKALTFNGGTNDAGGDALEIRGGDNFSDVTYDFVNENDGSIDISGNQTITYTGLEPIAANIDSDNVTLSYSAAGETITVSAGAAPGQMTVDSTAGEVVTFNNPTTSLTINGGDGNDQLDVNSFDSAFGASVLIDGQGGDDQINWSATQNINALSLTGEAIVLNSNVNTSGGQNYNGPVFLPAAVSINGANQFFHDIVDADDDRNIVNTGNVFFVGASSSFEVEIGGPTPGSGANDHDQLNVTGAVNIDVDAQLSVQATGNYVPSGSETFVIINNDGADAVNGTFANLNEGDVVSNDFLGSGLEATITYVGGDGNDVVISVEGPSSSITGVKFADVNGNGERDQEEDALPGVTIYIDQNQNGRLDEGEPSTVTDENGEYLFNNLWPGEYRVSEVTPPGTFATTPQDLIELADNPLSSRGLSVIIGDVDGDGRADIITGLLNGDIEVQFQALDGTFGNNVVTDMGSASNPILLAVGDVDADGKDDLLISVDDSGSRVELLKSNGRAAFTRNVVSATNNQVQAGLIAQIADSASPDIAFADNSRAYVFTTDGAGGIREATGSFGLDMIESLSIVAGDFDGDGQTDVAVGGFNYEYGSYYYQGSVQVLLNDGGNFSTGPASDVSDGKVNRMIAHDSPVDDDSDVDIIAVLSPIDEGPYGSYYDSHLTTLTNDGSGGFSTNGAPGLGGQPQFSAFGKFNSDGHPDVVQFGDYEGDRVIVTNGQYVYSGPFMDVRINDFDGGFAAGDIDGDGDSDVVVTRNPEGGVTQVLLNSASRLVTIQNNGDEETLDFGNTGEPAIISDYVWHDENGNGIQEIGEDGIEGAIVNLLDGQGAWLDSTTTDLDGLYHFDVVPGSYIVQFEIPENDGFDDYTRHNQGGNDEADSDADRTTGESHVITVAAGELVDDVDAGFVRYGAIYGFKFEDINGNGLWDDGESPLAGVTIYLDANNNGELDAGESSVVTDPSGFYQFPDLPPGDYIVREVVPTGYKQAFPAMDGFGTIELVSKTPVGEIGNGESHAPVISADGWWVAFPSASNNLVPGDTNGQFDIFVVDRDTGEIRRVSVDDEGGQSNGGSFTPSISENGRYVTFESYASNLVPDDTNDVEDIFVYDLWTDTIERVSVSSEEAEANGNSSKPWISNDGRFVVFQSDATNLVADDTNGVTDVFMHDRLTGETTRISESSEGAQANGSSGRAKLSADGRYIAFHSDANNLVAGDTNGSADVFVYDRLTQQIERVSLADGGGQSSGNSYYGALSADGRYVSFHSDADSLVTGDTNNSFDVFVHDRKTQQTQRVSVATDGTEGDGDSGHDDEIYPDGSTALSADGRFVAFISAATNLVPGDTNYTHDVFVHDRQTGETTRINVADDGTEANSFGFYPTLSADARFVSFWGPASNLVPGDTNGEGDVFVHDRLAASAPGAHVVTVESGDEVSDIDFGNAPLSSIHGRKFHDIDGDGEDFEESGLNGVLIQLIDVHTGEVIDQQLTHDIDFDDSGDIDPLTESGWYWFDNVPQGDYDIAEVPFPGTGYTTADFGLSAPTNPILEAADPAFPALPISGDVNDDGLEDLLLIHDLFNGEALQVGLNNGDGTFTPVQFLDDADVPGDFIENAVLADVDNDGDLDLVLATRGEESSEAQLVALLNNGNGQFADTATNLNITIQGLDPFDDENVVLESGDFNGDGFDDIVAGFETEIGESLFSAAKTFTNNGVPATVSFTDTATSLLQVDPDGVVEREALTSGDIDNDGDIDLILANSYYDYTGYGYYTGAFITYLLNDGSGDFGDVEFEAGGFIANINPFADVSIVASDFSGDGNLDVAIHYSDSFGQLGPSLIGEGGYSRHIVAILTGNGFGDFYYDTDRGLINSYDLEYGFIDAVDISSNGTPDIVLTQIEYSGEINFSSATTLFSTGVHYDIDVFASGQVFDGYDFGNYIPGSIHGFKFEDVDGDGGFDPEIDHPLEGVEFALIRADEGETAQSMTRIMSLGNGDDGETIATNTVDGEIYHLSGLGTPNVDEIFERVDIDAQQTHNIQLSGYDFDEATAMTFDPNTGNFLVADLDLDLLSITTSGEVTLLAAENMDHTSKGMAFDSAGTTLFSVSRNDGLLRIIDPTDGSTLSSTTVILPGETIDGFNGLAVNPITGEMFALAKINGESGRWVIEIDPTTGDAEFVLDTGDRFAGIAFEDDGNMLLVTGDGADDPEALYEVVNGPPVYQRAVTDEFGAFQFDYLAPGPYIVREVVPYDSFPTTPPDTELYLLSGQELVAFEGQAQDLTEFQTEVVVGTELMFGNFREGEIIGYKFEDINGNGIDDDEPRLAGVTIYLDIDYDGNFIPDETLSTVTDGNGEYEFVHLGPGIYFVYEDAPEGSVQTAGEPFPIFLESGEVWVTSAQAGGEYPLEVVTDDLAFGNAFLGSIHGYKFEDLNADGIRDFGLTGQQIEFAFSSFDEQTPLIYNGSAQALGGVLQLTPDQLFHAGSAFINRPFAVVPDSSFTTQFTFQLNDNTDGADGLAFIIANDQDGPSALGGGLDGVGYEDIQNSVGIVFDTYFNDQLGEPDGNHIAVFVDGESVDAEVVQSSPVEFQTGQPVNVWIDYDGTTNLLEVFVASDGQKPASATLTLNIDIAAHVGEQAFFGISAATGGLSDLHQILAWDLAVDEAAPLEPGMAGVTVDLLDGIGSLVDSVVTGQDGSFAFLGLTPGLYTVVETVPQHTVATTQTSFQVQLNSREEHVAYPGQAQLTDPEDPRHEVIRGADVQFGNTIPGSIRGFKFEDVDGDGIFNDEIDVPLAGTLITLTGVDGFGNNVDRDVTTDANGIFVFDNVIAGDYDIGEELLPGQVATTDLPLSLQLFSGNVIVADAHLAPPPLLRFDFEGSESVTQAPTFDVATQPDGYRRVLPDDLYNPAAGFGWDVAPRIDDRGPVNDGQPLEDVRRDEHKDHLVRTFSVDLPNGEYEVTVVMGDLLAKREQMTVTAEGTLALGNVTAEVGEWAIESFVVNVADGQLNLSFDDLGGDSFWVINGLEIEHLGAEHVIVDDALVIGNTFLGSIHGFKFEDINGDGQHDQGEPGMPDVTFTLQGDINGDGQADSLTVQTDASGQFHFENLHPGDYTVTETLPNGTIATTATSANITISSREEYVAIPGQADLDEQDPRVEVVAGTELFFGNAYPGSISGQKFEDVNGNGIRDQGEPALDGWTIELVDPSTGQVIATQVTSNGQVPPPTGSVLVATDIGQEATIAGFDDQGRPTDTTFAPYTGFNGGVRVATGDINGDGVDDIITGAGPGGAPVVTVFDGRDPQSQLHSFFAFDPSFTGGIFVASGDVNGDGVADIITSSDAGGAPHVRVFNGVDTQQLLADFLAYDAQFAGGVRVASGDVNGDGFDDIITGSGPGGGPHVKVFNGQNVGVELASFFAYEAQFAGGVFVASGDVNGDGFDDIITGTGAGGAPVVNVFSGQDPATELASFFAFDLQFTGGVRVASGDVNRDGFDDIITGSGPGGGPRVKVFDGQNTQATLVDFFAFDQQFNGGVFVADSEANVQGGYHFGDLPPGSYIVREVVPEGWQQTHPDGDGEHNVDVTSDNHVQGIDFGNFREGEISGYKFDDINGNSIDDDEPRLPGVTIFLDIDNDFDGQIDITLSDVTDGNGEYQFTDLGPGNYSLRENAPAGSVQTTTNAQPTLLESGKLWLSSDPSQGEDPDVVVQPTLVIGNTFLGSIHGFKFEDVDADGIYDGEIDTPLQGVDITLDGDIDGDGQADRITVTTDANGFFNFNALFPGQYTIGESPNAGSVATTSDTIELTINSREEHVAFTDQAELDAEDPRVEVFAGAELMFGNTFRGSIHGFKFEDMDGDGQYEPEDGDVPLPGVTITLSGGPTSDTQQTTTDQNGEFAFEQLMPGEYTVTETVTPQLINTTPTSAEVSIFSREELVWEMGAADLDEEDPRVEVVVGSDLMFGNAFRGSIHGFKFDDVDGNGVYDQQIDTPMAGITFTLLGDANGDGVQDPEPLQVVSGTDGRFGFIDLAPGDYEIVETLPDGMAATTPATSQVTVRSRQELVAFEGQADLDEEDPRQEVIVGGELMFANVVLGSISNFVWHDIDGNGVQDFDEPGVNGVAINLLDAQGAVLDSTTTSAGGQYVFHDLLPGNYRIEFVLPESFDAFTYANIGGDDTIDSDADTATGRSGLITIQSGDDDNTVDAGLVNFVTIGDYVWHDLNGNGLQDDGEQGLEEVRVDLINADTGAIEDTVYTDTNGFYEITGARPGNKIVEVELVLAAFSPPDIGFPDDTNDSDIGETGRTGAFLIESGDTVDFLDAGQFNFASVSDFVWDDLNANGLQDDGEPGLPNVFVELLLNGQVDQTTTTNANGFYSFGALRPDDYQLRFTLPNGYLFTEQNASLPPATPFRNPTNAFDVNNDSVVTPSDVLLIINHLNAVGAGPIAQGTAVPPYMDVNGDGSVTPIDAVLVINELNSGGGGGGTAPVQSAIEIDSDPDQQTGVTIPITLASGDTDNTIDAGMYQAATITGRKFIDFNLDGEQGENDPGLGAVRIFLDLNHNGTFDAETEPSAVTDTSGDYAITGLRPGTYDVREVVPGGFEPTLPAQGLHQDVSVAVGATVDNINFGNISTGDFPDLVVRNVAVTQPGVPLVPGDNVTVRFDVANTGTRLAAGQAAFQVYASRSGTLDGSAILLGTFNRAIDIDPLDSEVQQITQSVSLINADLTPGDYFFFAVADTNNAIEEFSDVNNTGRTTAASQVIWRAVANRPLTIFDADGTQAQISVTGPGQVDVTPVNSVDINISGTTTATNVAINITGGDGFFNARHITATSNLNSFTAAKLRVLGDINFQGIRNIVADKVDSPHVINIGAPVNAADRVNMTFGDLIDVTINSLTRIGSLITGNVRNTDTQLDTINTASIDSLFVNGVFQSDVNLTGAATTAGNVLSTAVITGNVFNSIWTLPGNVGTFQSGAVSFFQFLSTGNVTDVVTGAADNTVVDTDGNMNRLLVQGNFTTGLIAANHITTLNLRGDVADVDIVLEQDVVAGNPGVVAGGSIFALGTFLESTLLSRGHINNLTFGGMDSSTVLAGVFENFTTLDQSVLPDTTDDFARQATISNVTIGGNLNAGRASFIDSILAAWKFNSITLRDIAGTNAVGTDQPNSGFKFGFAAREIASYSRVTPEGVVTRIPDKKGHFQLRLVTVPQVDV